MARHKFPIGNNHNLGRKWKIKDTSNMSRTNGFKKGNQINVGRVKSEETRRKIGEKQRGTTRVFTEEHKANLSKATKGKKHRPFNAEIREQMRQRAIANPNKKFKDTSIELKIEAELKERGFFYQKQAPLCKIAIVDFFLPEHKIVIECDGDYWHGLPLVKEKDERKTKVLSENGLTVYRFKEYEINNSAKECVDRIVL